MEMAVSKNLNKLAEAFNPVPLYITGGYVRNRFLGLPLSDIDICSPLSAEAAAEIFIKCGCVIKSVYGRLGTVKLSLNNEDYEYTAFRKDIYGKGHTPDLVEFCESPQEDARRRDFTVNSIYYDIYKGEVSDPLGGIKDIENKVIRAAEPDFVFSADGLRLLRMVRFASELGFTIDKETFETAKSNNELLKDITGERVFEEFNKILHSDCKYPALTKGAFPHYRGFEMLKELGLLPRILPLIDLSYGVGQRKDFHKYDVFEHTAQTLKFSDKSIRLAAALHDIGKGICYRESGNFYGHETAGAEHAQKILGQEGLKCPKSLISETVFLIRHHMYDLNGKTKENKIKLFIAENYKHIEKLLLLKQADYLGCGLHGGIAPTVEKWQNIITKMKEENTPLGVKELNIGGEDIIKQSCPERLISSVLKQLLNDCILNPRLNKKEILIPKAERYIKQFIRTDNRTK